MFDYKYNEKAHVEQILINGFGTKNINSELKLIATYYKEQGKAPKEREELLYDFCSKHLAGFSKVKYFSKIKSALNYANRKDVKLIEIENIDVHKSELEFIDALDLSVEYKKIVFTLLVLDKLNKTIQIIRRGKANNEHYFGGYEKNYKELLTSSKVNLNSRRKNGKTIHNVIGDLADHGLVEIRGNGYIKLNFMYYLNVQDEVVVQIKKFSEIGYYYDLHIGTNKVVKCECCGIPIKKTNNKTKYCFACSKFIKNEQNKKYYHLGK